MKRFNHSVRRRSWNDPDTSTATVRIAVGLGTLIAAAALAALSHLSIG
ncbi:hypothetical protein ACU4GI_46850 (plasmid) [Cupriavidus basilensis]